VLKLAPFNAWQALLKVIETSLDGLATFLADYNKVVKFHLGYTLPF
jgi:hypothetical protein